MRLVWFILHGYKRFEKRTEVHLDGRVIAISGPNEAGKSSLLDGLAHLSRRARISPAELTRRTAIPSDQVILRARFLLDKNDIAEVADLHGGSEARWLIVEKLQDGSFRTGVEPRPTRDLKPRQRAVAALRKLEPILARAEAKRAASSAEVGHANGEDEHVTTTEVKSLADALDVETEYLGGAVQDNLASIEQKLAAEAPNLGGVGERAVSVIRALMPNEAAHPHDIARRRLAERQPQFLPFRDAERTLQSQYDVINDVPSLPQTAALRNLAALGDFDLDAVAAAVEAGDVGLVDTLTKQANEQLARRFRVSWRQSEVTVRFRIDEATLRILIESPHEPASRIDERSDGMRAFIALLAYTAVRAEGSMPILLIDEAESHLHYAAQADLVQVLTEQAAAAQVIYTTHSAGCLPEDLGTGVRLVVPIEETERSRVINWFWEDEPGFGPLLHAMGYAAGAFAFTPTRFAVFAEGATELVLLPALLREATQRRRLEFQIAPGLALVNRETASTLELEAARVKYVVDSDQGGRHIAGVLHDGGVSADDIFELLDGSEDGLTIEDFVAAETYRLAVNEELRRSGYPEHQLSRGEIPPRGRVAFIEAWTATRGVRNPPKVRVAARVVELREDRPLISGSRRIALRGLYDRLRGSLKIDEAVKSGIRL